VTAAVVTVLFYVARIPWIGQHLLTATAAPVVLARLVQDGFGIAAVVLLVAVPAPDISRSSPGPGVDSTPMLRAS
jgi:hypothetical protein